MHPLPRRGLPPARIPLPLREVPGAGRAEGFIDKFWVALVWDVNRETQKNPNEQEVKVERTVGVEGRAKKADYAFLAPNFRDVRFFVEAKCAALDRQIDQLVYELYSLAPEEVAIVEAGGGR